MNAVIEKTIEESSRVESNYECNLTCGSQCLAIENVKFVAKEVCLETSCNCFINLFYRPDACDYSCAQNC
jgi:hypothetical protein